MKPFTYAAGILLGFGCTAHAPAAFVINEIDSDTPGTEVAEFIELKGNPDESAAGLVLVLFNGVAAGPTSYHAVDLSTATANAEGYILLAGPGIPGADFYLPTGVLQNGEDAVALYQANVSSFPNGTAPTTANLIDAIVYETAGDADRNWTGLGSPPVYDEAGLGAPAQHSLARIPDGTGPFACTPPTPGTANAHSETFTISGPSFLRMNQVTGLLPASAVVTLQNTGTAPLQVTSFELDGASDSQFSTLLAASPAPPVTLQYNETTTLTVRFQETDVSSNRIYQGAITYVTDNPTSPSGSMPFTAELVRGTPAANVGDVMVNEICYNPQTNDYNNDGSTAGQNDEFVELVNMTDSPILIEGWEQRCKDHDTDNYHSFVFPVGATIPARGFVTVFTSGNPTGFAPGTVFTYHTARIRNTGAFVGIHDGTKLVDGVAYLGAEDTPDVDGFLNAGVSINGGSLGRRPDGANSFRTFAPDDPVEGNRPTPNASNNAPTSAGDWALFE